MSSRAVIDNGGERAKPEPSWATPHAIALELATARLRDFSTSQDGGGHGQRVAG